jgi:hypothetical protein
MKNIHPLYRRTYVGESIVTNRTYKDGKWKQDTTRIFPTASSRLVSTNALVIGNGESRSKFDLNVIAEHKGGSVASGALQTYGCNALYRDYVPHFLVATRNEVISELIDSNVTAESIVYANLDITKAHPGKFYYIPQNPCWNSGAMAAYLACFDGHTKVFLVGFDGVDTPTHSYNLYQGTNGYPELEHGYSEEFYVKAMSQVFAAYPKVDFVRVMPTNSFRLPEEWKWVPNLRQIDFNQFVNEVDL